jgi:hypothetical protein
VTAAEREDLRIQAALWILLGAVAVGAWFVRGGMAIARAVTGDE